MPELKHPTIPDVVATVEDSEVESWTKSGWTKTETKAVRQAKADS